MSFLLFQAANENVTNSLVGMKANFAQIISKPIVLKSENNKPKMNGGSGDNANPCSSKSLEEGGLTSGNSNTNIASEFYESDDDNESVEILDSLSEFVDQETKKGLNDSSDLEKLVLQLEPIVCLGIDPHSLSSFQMMKDFPDDTRHRYLRTWNEFLKCHPDICIGNPPTFAQLYEYIEMKLKRGKQLTTVTSYYSHLNFGLRHIYKQQLSMSYWKNILK